LDTDNQIEQAKTPTNRNDAISV